MGFNVVTDWQSEANNVVLDQKTISDVCNSVINTIKSGLPEEARTIEIFDYILDESKHVLKSKIVDLK